MKIVSSSNIQKVGYDEKTETMRVEFNGGTLYEYFKVPSSVYTELVNAQSIGSYLGKNIRNHYACQKVDIQKDKLNEQI